MAAPPLPRIAEYRLRNIWSTGTDADTELYDDTSYATQPGVRVDGIGRATHRAYAPPGTPACDFTLPNYDGRYSPGGPLGNFVGRGPATTLDAVWGTDVVVDDPDALVDDPDFLVDGVATLRLFTGSIDTANQQIDRSAPASVQVRSLGTIQSLLEQQPRIPLYENIRTDEAIALVLDAIGWAADARSLDTGDTDLLYFWANGDASAADLINRILGAEGVPACAYEDPSGVFHFEGRQFRASNQRSTDVQWQLVDGGDYGGLTGRVDDPEMLVDDPEAIVDGAISDPIFYVLPAQWSSNPDEVVANVTATVNVRTETAVQKVWEYGEPLTLAAGETRDIEATSSDPFKSAVTPLAATDYTVSSGSLSSVTLLEDSGQRARIRWVAGGGGATIIGVTSNGPQLRAVSLPVTTTVPVTSTVDTDISAARFRPRDHALNLWPEITANQALALTDNHARRYQRPRDQMTVQVANVDGRHMHMILTVRISDRLLVRHTHGSINQAFLVESLSHGLTDGGGLHRLTLHLERVTDDMPARFGTARFGFDNFSE